MIEDWQDLSDDELEARLKQKVPLLDGDPYGVAEQLVASRDEEDVAAMISEILSG